MKGRSVVPLALALGIALVALAAGGPPAGAKAPKRGGVLNSVLIEDPPGFLIHEPATVSNVWPMMPSCSNLGLCDSLKPMESVARPMLGWRKEYFAQWPPVKNLLPHNALHRYGRMQEAWLDK